MSRTKSKEFDAVYDFLQNKRPDETTLADVLELAELSARSMQRAERRQRLILNGPQLDGPETSQSEVDAMFR